MKKYLQRFEAELKILRNKKAQLPNQLIAFYNEVEANRREAEAGGNSGN